MINVKDQGATGDGVTDDTSAINASLLLGDAIYFPEGVYRFTNLVIGADKQVFTDSFSTMFFQLPGQSNILPAIKIDGSNVYFGSCRIKGNISSDTLEFMHGIQCLNSSASIYNITIGDLIGEDIRGDVLYIGDVTAHPIHHVRFGDVTGTNILRNVVSIVGGNNIVGGDVSGTQIGYTVFDIEPEPSTSPVMNITLSSVSGAVCQIAGTTAAAYCDSVVIKLLNLNGAPDNSNPAYSANDNSSGLRIRNIRNLQIGTYRARDFSARAVEHIFNTGELSGQSISIGAIDWANIRQSGGGAYAQLSNVQNTTIGAGKVAGLGTSRYILEGNNSNPSASQFAIKNIEADGGIVIDTESSFIDNCSVSNASAWAFMRVSRSVIAGGLYSVSTLGHDCTDITVLGAEVVAASSVWNSFSSQSIHYRHTPLSSTYNSVLVGLNGGVGASADNGNAGKTLVANGMPSIQRWNTPLTADRTVTLSSAGAFEGAVFKIIRTASGAFNLNVGASTTKALAAGQWCEVTYSGSAWLVTGAGNL